MSSREKLLSILDELESYKRKRKDLMYKYINERLKSSLKAYYSDIDKYYNYLNKKNSKTVFRQLGRDLDEE